MTELALPSNNRVSLTQVIELGVQKTYHDLTILAETLHGKPDFERKVEIVNFAERTRQLFLRLLALVKWAGGASKIEQCMDIVTLLDKQALLFINTADNMVNIARTTLVQARLPSFQLPCAVEVLTLGTYSRMPTCVRDRIVPPDPITLEEKRSTLARLDHIIEQRLAVSKIHPAMRNLKVEFGRVIFHVENEFDLKLTLRGDSPNLPWCVLGLDLLVEDADTGEGKDLVHPAQINMMEQILQKRMNESQVPLVDVFTKLHNFCLSLQIEVLHDQIERLMRDRLASYVKIKDHKPGQSLAISYWGSNVLQIQIDHQDSSINLKLTHTPEFKKNFCETDRDNNKDIFKPGNVSIEQLIASTIQQRAVIKLNELASELRDKKYGTCTIYGVPSLLHVCCLDPCTPSEELIISLDLNGAYMAHVPQYEKDCPLAENIQESLNGNRSKLGTYFDQLKIWLLKKRCMTTIDYLSVTATESLPLGSKAHHGPKLDDKVPRLFFQFNKYNHYYLMAEFKTSETNPYGVDTRYSLLTTESVSNITGDGLEIVDSSDSVDSVKRDLVVVENALELDVESIISACYSYESSAHDRSLAFNNNIVSSIKNEYFKNYRHNHHNNNNKFNNNIINNQYQINSNKNNSNKQISFHHHHNKGNTTTTTHTDNDANNHNNNINQHQLESDNYLCNPNIGLKQPVLLVNEIPLLVSFCEERLAYLALEKELRNRNLKYQVSQSEASGFSYSITFLRIPSSKLSSSSSSGSYSSALRNDTSVMMVNLHEKPQSTKIWHCSYIFDNCPIITSSRKEQSAKRFVFTPYESPLLNSNMVSKFLDDTQLDWASMSHLYDVVKIFSADLKNEPSLLDSITLKSFNYKKLVILYGEQRSFGLTLFWRIYERKFHLIFSIVGGAPFTLNPHSFMATHYKHEFNQHKSIKSLVKQLNNTLKPLQILHNFPVYPFLGFIPSRPTFPVTSFCLIPLSSSRVMLIYRNWASIDIKIESDGQLMVRDGSLSRFDRNKTIEDLNAINNFEALMYHNQYPSSTSYLMNLKQFASIFQVQHIEKHLGMSFTIENILKKLSAKQLHPTAKVSTPAGNNSGGGNNNLNSRTVCYASETQVQYTFTMDLARSCVQMKATPMAGDWRQDEMEIIERYFETRIGCYPYKADPFLCLSRILFDFPKKIICEFIKIFKLEMVSDHMP